MFEMPDGTGGSLLCGAWPNFSRTQPERAGASSLRENAAILHGRRPLEIFARVDEQRIAMLHRHIGPVVPRRDADLL